MPETDAWRTLHQVLPVDIYSRLMIQMARLGRANGTSIEAFSQDDKNTAHVGPRVSVWENLVILMERTEDDKVFQV